MQALNRTSLIKNTKFANNNAPILQVWITCKMRALLR